MNECHQFNTDRINLCIEALEHKTKFEKRTWLNIFFVNYYNICTFFRIPDDLGFNVFNKFTMSQKRKPQVSVPPSVAFSWSAQDPPSPAPTFAQGFDNPMYGSTPLQVTHYVKVPMEYTAILTAVKMAMFR